MLRHLMTVQVIFRGRSITYSTNYGVCVCIKYLGEGNGYTLQHLFNKLRSEKYLIPT